MTCVIGLVKDGVIYFGSDSLAAAGWESCVLAADTPKIFKRGAFLFGYTGSPRFGQLLQHKLVIPEQDGLPDAPYILVTVLDAIRDCLKSNGLALVENNQEEGGFCLIGYKGKIYKVNSDYGITVAADDFRAIGCGDVFALGALKALEGTPPMERIARALEISAYFSVGVGGPFHIISSADG
jgi:ATP-dependent protease HslVU (ClpYQ) peptidase subunit